MQETMKKRALELLEDGTVSRVIGWTAGEFSYDMTPAVFLSIEEVEKKFAYNGFCGSNVSKYLIKESEKEGRVLAFLKPCDTFSFNQLCAEHRIKRENVYVAGIPCDGMADPRKIKASGVDGITGITEENGKYTVKTVYGDSEFEKAEITEERCLTCKSRRHAVYDELIGEEGGDRPGCGRFDLVEKLEKMTSEERFEFWRGELSRCIRCNACRNVCPACTCEQCVFDNPNSGISQKAAADTFEENMYHIIRAFHVAGRCTDCGECSRVCPENIPLHLLNRKFIKDINSLYGEYQAGDDDESRNPLTSYSQNDADPGIVHERGVE